jgi:fucose 4-O-acetylase-like acetyltransferase
MTVSVASDARQMHWVDIFKGIGIIAIVAGHSLPQAGITSFLFLFHVPLFFYLSGYLHRPNPNFMTYFRKKATHLLIPYVGFLAVFSPLSLLHCVRHSEPVKATLMRLAWGGSHLAGEFAAFWFVTCLFCTQQLMNWLFCRFRLPFVITIVAGLMVAGYATRFLLPLNMGVTAEAAPFYLAGYMCKRYQAPKWSGVVGAVVGLAAAVLIHFDVHVSYDMKYGKYGVPGLSFLLAMGTILAILKLSQYLSQVAAVPQALAPIGSASMGIMFVHEFILQMLGRFAVSGSIAGFVFTLTLSFALTRVLAARPLTRMIFLGDLSGIAKGPSRLQAVRL